VPSAIPIRGERRRRIASWAGIEIDKVVTEGNAVLESEPEVDEPRGLTESTSAAPAAWEAVPVMRAEKC
jgi:hypothetical protein